MFTTQTSLVCILLWTLGRSEPLEPLVPSQNESQIYPTTTILYDCSALTAMKGNHTNILYDCSALTAMKGNLTTLEKAVKVQDAIFLMPGVISNRDEDHDALPSWGDRDSTMWILLQQIVELFSPTITAIKALEGQHYVTQSLIILQLCLIEESVSATLKKCKSLFLNFLIF
jgi:hypothetical protein